MSDHSQAVEARAKPPSLLACLSCRRSHLKCAGRRPGESQCQRCAEKGIECCWQSSRRGYREHRKPAVSGAAPARVSHGTTFQLDASVATSQHSTYDEIFNPLLLNHSDGDERAPSPNSTSSTTSIPREGTLVPAAGASSSDLIDVYYRYFHPSHPFVIPRKLFLQDQSLLPDSLQAVMRYLASHYAQSPNSKALQQAAAVIFSDQVPEDGHKVQALLLFSTACYARYEPDQGIMAIDLAIQLALHLGMNRRSYAEEHSNGNATVAESWRRTWWTLFILEGLSIVLGSPNTTFRSHVFCDVLLPGSDERYNACRPLTRSRSLSEFRNRVFDQDNEYQWSSFVYAISAMYIMGSVLSLGPDTFAITDPAVEAVDASMSEFLLSLPPEKRDVVACDGTSDECLLVAHMILNWAAILLHRPRSTLTFIRNCYQTTCTKEEPSAMPALAYASHTSKTIHAANSLMLLASIPRPLTQCTPYMMCGITMAATVHLPAYALATEEPQAAAIKARIQLGISALGVFSEIWPRANITKYQVAMFAREVLTAPAVFVNSTSVGLPSVTTQIEGVSIPQLQSGYPEDDWLESLAQEELFGEMTAAKAPSTNSCATSQLAI